MHPIYGSIGEWNIYNFEDGPAGAFKQ
jgi:hypothetical protein